MRRSLLPQHHLQTLTRTRKLRRLLSWKGLAVLLGLCYLYVQRSVTTHQSSRDEVAYGSASGVLSSGEDGTFQMKSVRNLEEPPKAFKDEQNTQEVANKDHHQHTDQQTLEIGASQTAPDSDLIQLADDSRRALAFPDFAEYERLVQKSASLPDLIVIPFEEAVSADKLEPWYRDWVADAIFDAKKWGGLQEPRIDFIYTWVNGSEQSFIDVKGPYELNSSLNDPEGKWLASHASNRYRDWNELLFSLRSIEEHAPFRNRVQILVNAIVDSVTGEVSKQEPDWLNPESKQKGAVQMLAQEELFDESHRGCLPSFNSLTIENQIHNTPSEVDMAFALSDDMLLGKPHAASDIYSPLYGPMIGFKSNSYNTASRPTKADAERFGEKPWLIYTSWLLNRRFGSRKRKGMAHFGHAISRKVMAETMRSFPGLELQSACSRFRGDFGFQLYSWYALFHYTIERHREVLLWSYLMVRADKNGDGYLSWSERKAVLKEILEGHENEAKSTFRARNYYLLPDVLEDAGLEPPAVNFDILWTSMDGPFMTKSIDCSDFNVEECLAPGFTVDLGNDDIRNPIFSTAAILDRAARQRVECGDCLIKILLHRVHKGLSPLLPDPVAQSRQYDVAVKALMRYKYVVHEPDGLFVMVTDAEQVDSALLKRFKKREKLVGQLCLNDDVSTEDEDELRELREALNAVYLELFPTPSSFEKTA